MTLNMDKMIEKMNRSTREAEPALTIPLTLCPECCRVMVLSWDGKAIVRCQTARCRLNNKPFHAPTANVVLGPVVD